MQIKSYKDLVGLSIAQARAAFNAVSYAIEHADTNEANNKSWQDLYVNARHTIDRLAREQSALQAEVDRLTKVIASYDTPEELQTAHDFIKAFNIDVEKTQTDKALKAMKQSIKEGMDDMPSVSADEAYTQAHAVVESPEELAAEEKPSKDSLRKVWRLLEYGRGRGYPETYSKWTRRRLTQLKRLQVLGYAWVDINGYWWQEENKGPKKDEV